MTIYAAVDLTTPKLLLVTDEEGEAYKKIEEAKRLDCGREAKYIVLQSNDLRLSPSATICVSFENELESLAKNVRIRMKERNINEASFPCNFNQVLLEIASDTYFNMARCDICETDAIDMALKEKGLV